MNINLMAKGICRGFEQLGVEINKISKDGSLVYVTVPSVTNIERFPTGDLLAKRIQEAFDEMSNGKVKVKYKQK